MREFLLIKGSLANKISYYHLALFVLSLPFDRFYSHLLLASLGVHTLIRFNIKTVKPLFTLRTLVLQSVAFVTLISTIYTINLKQAFVEWALAIPIFVFPLLFCFNSLDLAKYRGQLLLTFALGCTATTLYLYIDAFTTIWYYHLPLQAIISPAFTNHNFSEPIDMHATFFSLQVALALVYLLSVLVSEKLTLNSKLLYGICSFILAAGIVQLSSKSVFATLFVIINIVIPYVLLQGSRRRRFMTIATSVSCFIVIGIFNCRTFHDRFLGQLKEDLSPSFAGQTVEPRLERWKIAGTLIAQSPVIGHGAGSEIGLLGEEYFNKRFYDSYLHRLNAHNEYLSFLVKSGIWGLGVYLATLVFGLKKAIRKNDVVFFSFTLLLAIVSLSENILDADKGVIFYSFFFCFFVFSSEQQEALNLPIKRHKNLRRLATKQAPVPSLLQMYILLR